MPHTHNPRFTGTLLVKGREGEEWGGEDSRFQREWCKSFPSPAPSSQGRDCHLGQRAQGWQGWDQTFQVLFLVPPLGLPNHTTTPTPCPTAGAGRRIKTSQITNHDPFLPPSTHPVPGPYPPPASLLAPPGTEWCSDTGRQAHPWASVAWPLACTAHLQLTWSPTSWTLGPKAHCQERLAEPGPAEPSR